MGFHDVRMPESVARGYSGGPGFATVVQDTASGHEVRIARWAQGRHRYRAEKTALDAGDIAELKAFYLARRGALFAFRWKDHLDFTSAADGQSAPTDVDQVIGTGDGTRVLFPLRKQYDLAGLNPYVRPITLPVDGTVVVAFDGSPQSSGWTVNLTSGVVTFDGPPSLDVVITAGFEFDVPVRFEKNVDALFAPRIVSFQNYDLADIDLIEVRDETELPDPWNPRGATTIALMNASISLSPSMGYLLKVNPTTTVSAYLPNPTNWPAGEYHMVLVKSGASGTVQIRDHGGVAVGSPLAAGDRAWILLTDDGSGVKGWEVIA